MTEDKEALVQHYRQMRADLLSAIDGLSDELLAEPSLDGWSVKDHLAHLAFWDEIRTGEVERISAGYDSAWPEAADTEAHNAFMQPLRQALSADQIRWELKTSREKLEAAILAATPRGLDGSLYREAGLRSTHEAQHSEWIKRWRREKGL
jgi:uncharacterized damage-inducible protein DinB